MWIEKSKLLWLAIIILIIVNITTVATVYHNRQNSLSRAKLVMSQNRAPLEVAKLVKSLNFSSEQQEQFLSNLKKFRDEHRSSIKKINSSVSKLWSELNQDNPNREVIESLNREIAALSRDEKNMVSDFYITITKDATPEQKKEFKKAFSSLFLREVPPSRAPREGEPPLRNSRNREKRNNH